MSSIAGNTSTTAVLLPGETETHTIDAAGDFDWFRVSLTAGMTYSFTVTSAGGTGIGLTGPDSGVYTGLGLEIESTRLYSAATSTISITATTTGFHYFGVGDLDSNTGQYQVSWVATDSILGNTATAQVLSAAAASNSRIDAEGDADWFKVTMTSGLSYGFEVKGNDLGQNGLVGGDLVLLDGLGNAIKTNEVYSATINDLVHNATQTGQYFIQVNERTYGTTGDYSLRWIATDTIQNNATTTNTLTAGVAANSRIDVAGDADWFKLSMTSGLSYGFELKANGTAGQTGLVGGDLVLFDTLGNARSSHEIYSQTINTLNFNATQSGQYFVQVNERTYGTAGDYSLRWIATDTIQNNLSTTSALARNSTATSRLDVGGDADWFRVTMVAGETYGFQLKGQGVGALPMGDLVLLDAQGNVVKSMTSISASNDTLTHTAVTSGTYYVAVQDSAEGTGGYSLRNIGADLVLSNVLTGRTIADGTRISGNIDMQTDSDWYKFQAQQGQTYVFTLSGNGTALELDNVRLILRDAAGNVVSDIVGTSATVTHLATTTGPLFLDVRGYGSSDFGAYVLSVVSNALTLTGSAGNDVLQGGSSNTVMTGLEGNDWMDGGIGNDKLFGGIGNDVLYGNAGNDTIYAGDGNDYLSGGSGNDFLEGQAGSDRLIGGTGADIFLFRPTSGADTVLDFEDGIDRIRIIGGPTSFAGLTRTVIGDDVRISFGTASFLMKNVALSELTSSDFLFA